MACLLIQVLVTGPMVAERLSLRYHWQVELVSHILETLASIGVGKLVIIKNLNAALHPGVDQALVRKLACVCEAHREGCAS